MKKQYHDCVCKHNWAFHIFLEYKDECAHCDCTEYVPLHNKECPCEKESHEVKVTK